MYNLINISSIGTELLKGKRNLANLWHKSNNHLLMLLAIQLLLNLHNNICNQLRQNHAILHILESTRPVESCITYCNFTGIISSHFHIKVNQGSLHILSKLPDIKLLNIERTKYNSKVIASQKKRKTATIIGHSFSSISAKYSMFIIPLENIFINPNRNLNTLIATFSSAFPGLSYLIQKNQIM